MMKINNDLEINDPPFQSLIERSSRGDETALNILFQRFYPTVERMVRRRLSTEQHAKRPWLQPCFSTNDMVQEVFRSVLRDIKSFEGRTPDAFAGYLAMIARNRIVDSVRYHQAFQRDRRRSTDYLEAQTCEALGANPSDAATLEEEAQRYASALATFEHRDQLLLRARFEGTHTYDDLAAQLGYPSGFAARRAFFKVQARLTQRLGQPGLHASRA